MSDSLTAFVQAVSRLPVYQGVAWRAAGFELTVAFTVEASVPVSRDLRVATENFRARGAHLFLCTGARDIGMLSANPAEREFALLPGALLVPASAYHDVAGLRVQIVIEQPPAPEPIPPLPTDDTIAELIQTARSADPFSVSSPGKFGA